MNQPDQHSGSTTLLFSTSLGTMIEGLKYRLSSDSGAIWSGTSGRDGKGVTITASRLAETHQATDLWTLTTPCIIQMEVMRDDGSWKVIASFRHTCDNHTQVRVIAGAIAVPFEMAAI